MDQFGKKSIDKTNVQYCRACLGFGYIKRGADFGHLYCQVCNGKQTRPQSDYNNPLVKRP